MLVLCGVFLFLITGLVIKSLAVFLKMTRPITLTRNSITIGNDVFVFSEIKQIETIAFVVVFYEYFYGASITLLNGDIRYVLGEQFYENDAMLFQELERINPENLQVHISNNEGIIAEENFDFNIYLSTLFLLSIAILLISAAGIFKYDTSSWIILFFLGLSVSIYFLAVRTAYYFILDGTFLHIKNKLLFGYSKTFILADIKGSIIYQKGFGKGARLGIRIISKDYRSVFFASELSQKKWSKLGEALRKAGVTVVNGR